MKKKIIIGIIVVLAVIGIYNFIQMKYTYNYFNVDLDTDIRYKKQLIKDAEKENKKHNEHKKNIEYVQKKPENVNIPILMYHSISNINPINKLLMPVDKFEEQIKWLKENGFTPMLMKDVVGAFKTGKVPKRPVALTFDDGYFDNYTDAYRILEKYDMKGTFFVITNYVNQDGMYMNLNMLKEMKAHGMDIQSHTADHKRLNWRGREAQTKAINDAKIYLKEKLGIDNKYLCYPVGRYTKTTLEVTKSAGMEAAVTTKNGIANIDNGILSLDRVRMEPMSLDDFKKIFQEYLR